MGLIFELTGCFWGGLCLFFKVVFVIDSGLVWGGRSRRSETGVLRLHALRCCLLLSSMPSAEILSHVRNFFQGPVWRPAVVWDHVEYLWATSFQLFKIMIIWTTSWIIVFFKAFNLINLIVVVDKRPLLSSIFSNTFFTRSANRAFFKSFLKTHPWMFKSIYFLANILQGAVPGLCGLSPGAKLKLHFCNIYTVACGQSVNVNFTPYCIHLKLALIVTDISEKAPRLTPEWNVEITNPNWLLRIWVGAWPDLGSVHPFSDKDKLFSVLFHGLQFVLSLSNISHLLLLFFPSHHASWWKSSLLVLRQLGKKLPCLIMCSELCKSLTRGQKIRSLH